MNSTYGTMYSTAASAAAYDEVVCQHDDDAVWAAEQELLRKLIRRFVRDPAAARTVDFACGSGRILKVLQPVVGGLVGVDISEAMLERAADRIPDIELIQADIVADPEAVPANVDLITAFRFLLLAEPSLRESCLRVLAGRLRADSGVLILNSHGNPRSFRFGALIRDAVLKRDRRLPRFSMRDMKALARRSGLELVSATGCGFIPHTLRHCLPSTWCLAIERGLAGVPILWRFGTNLLFVLRSSSRNQSP
jgi:predicted TPR repeat methyltransferase